MIGGTSNFSKASNMNSNTNEEKLNLNSHDVVWEYREFINSNDLDKLKCKLCSHRCNGGIYRVKQHIAGIRGKAKACSVAKEDYRKKCKAALDERKK